MVQAGRGDGLDRANCIGEEQGVRAVGWVTRPDPDRTLPDKYSQNQADRTSVGADRPASIRTVTRPDVPPADPPGVPVTVRLAAGLTVLEALAFAAYGLALVPDLVGGRPEAGSSASVFYLVYAVFLGVCAAELLRLRSWARAPVVLAQLIQLLVGTSFWGGGTTGVAVLLIGLAVAVLVAVLHPRSVAALGGR